MDLHRVSVSAAMDGDDGLSVVGGTKETSDMSWSIACLKNEVVINAQIARDLYECGAQICYTWKDKGGPAPTDEELLDYMVGYYDYKDGEAYLYFNTDHREHMDYLFEEEIQAVLCKHQVQSDICFGSLEGDNAGQFWGYRFDGKGGMVKLQGHLTFKPDWNAGYFPEET